MSAPAASSWVAAAPQLVHARHRADQAVRRIVVLPRPVEAYRGGSPNALFIVIASVLPSRLLAVMLPIAAAGSGPSPAGRRWPDAASASRCLLPVPPPKPNSRFDCASKWLRTTGLGSTCPAPDDEGEVIGLVQVAQRARARMQRPRRAVQRERGAVARGRHARADAVDLVIGAIRAVRARRQQAETIHRVAQEHHDQGVVGRLRGHAAEAARNRRGRGCRRRRRRWPTQQPLRKSRRWRWVMGRFHSASRAHRRRNSGLHRISAIATRRRAIV